MNDQLYQRVVAITEEYLGPTAQRFMARQISYHFHKKPEELVASDIPKLVEWMRISLALLTDNTHTVDECIGRIIALGSGGESSAAAPANDLHEAR